MILPLNQHGSPPYSRVSIRAMNQGQNGRYQLPGYGEGTRLSPWSVPKEFIVNEEVILDRSPS